MDGASFSPQEIIFTLDNSSTVAQAVRLLPASGPVEGGTDISVAGRGFSRYTEGEVSPLACFFGEDGGVTRASFVSTRLVRCTSPSAANANTTTSVALSVGTASMRSSALYYTFLLPGTTPTVISIVPPFVDLRSMTQITLTGSGFAPLGHELRCRFGEALTVQHLLSTHTTAPRPPLLSFHSRSHCRVDERAV